MRKVTKQAADAFVNEYPFKSKNTTVELKTPQITKLLLHGNLIAEKIKGKIYICNCGWFTPTTKERLNALPGVSISQRKRIWYLNGKEWNGARILIKHT